MQKLYHIFRLASLLFTGMMVLGISAEDQPLRVFSPPLTESRQNVKPWIPIIRNSGNDVYMVMHPPAFSRQKQEAMEMLDPEKKMPRYASFQLATWAALYAGLTDLVPNSGLADKETNLYAFGLLCAGQYDKAAKKALTLLEKNPSDYGALVVLGLLSGRNQDYFKYLEKAFAMNPVKTISIFDWQISCLPINVEKEWDFLDFYISLVYQYRDRIQKEKLSEMVAGRLYGIIRAKYYSPEEENAPKEMATLLYILQSSVNREEKPQGRLIQTRIYRGGKLIEERNYE